MTEQVRLLLVDTPALFRRSQAVLLGRKRGIQVVGEAATGTETIAQVQALQPDVVVLDPLVPDGGVGLVEQICQQAPNTQVVVLTLSTATAAVSRALQAGAQGYLHKECDPDELVRAIERVHAGEIVVAIPASASEAGERRWQPAAELDLLTAREIEVLQLIAQGLTNPEIARALCITEHTTKGHVARILSKLGFENRVQLATFAMQQGIVASQPGESMATESS